MISEILDSIKRRKNFYRDHYRKAVTTLFFTLIINIVLITALIYVKLTQPEPKFYATSNVGGITLLKALNAPNMSDKPLID